MRISDWSSDVCSSDLDVGSVMARMIALWKSKGHKKTDQTEWWSRIEGWRARRSLDFRQSGEEILPQRAIAALYEATKGRNPIITTEVDRKSTRLNSSH